MTDARGQKSDDRGQKSEDSGQRGSMAEAEMLKKRTESQMG
jgi:hypothetical protein